MSFRMQQVRAAAPKADPNNPFLAWVRTNAKLGDDEFKPYQIFMNIFDARSSLDELKGEIVELESLIPTLNPVVDTTALNILASNATTLFKAKVEPLEKLMEDRKKNKWKKIPDRDYKTSLAKMERIRKGLLLGKPYTFEGQLPTTEEAFNIEMSILTSNISLIAKFQTSHLSSNQELRTQAAEYKDLYDRYFKAFNALTTLVKNNVRLSNSPHALYGNNNQRPQPNPAVQHARKSCAIM